MSTLLRTEGVGKSHTVRGARYELLDDISLGFEAGQVTALAGDSGSGKTLLLHILALLETPDRGRVYLGGDDMTNLAGPARAATRRRRLGIVFRTPDLLPRHSAYRNVLVPYAGSRAEGERRARELLDRTGLTPRAAHLPGALTAGEQRRVALVRALINDPAVILADEPTGDAELLAYFRELADEGRAVVLASADPAVCGIADVVHRLERGVVVEEETAEPLETESHQLQ
ncbi:ABC transporter ATP-binding protein [Streptomyces niveiscabiei]|uniref:ABC transporter ATP-binding protein n=1 Tax=Streptomyces niveiscabiei TaxID=164115 RepID=A0ABW9I6X9_9ACTN